MNNFRPEYLLSEVPHNLRPDPSANRNRNTIPNHPVRIIVTAGERERIRHALQPRILSHRVRTRAAYKVDGDPVMSRSRTISVSSLLQMKKGFCWKASVALDLTPK